MIRTWAVWGKPKVVGLVLFIGAAIIFVVQFYLTFLFANSLTCESASLQRHRACTLSKIL